MHSIRRSTFEKRPREDNNKRLAGKTMPRQMAGRRVAGPGQMALHLPKKVDYVAGEQHGDLYFFYRHTGATIPGWMEPFQYLMSP
ncbi:unnamed protein product, partial [Iphiclides podalirius]